MLIARWPNGHHVARADVRSAAGRWCDTLATTTPRSWEWDSDKKRVIISKGSIRNSLLLNSFTLQDTGVVLEAYMILPPVLRL